MPPTRFVTSTAFSSEVLLGLAGRRGQALGAELDAIEEASNRGRHPLDGLVGMGGHVAGGLERPHRSIAGGLRELLGMFIPAS